MAFRNSIEDSLIYGLNYKSRCIVGVLGETDKTQFMVGTLSIKDQNEIHIFEVPKDGADLGVIVFPHKQEIWGLAPSYADKELLFSIYSNENFEKQSTLWRLDYDNYKMTNLLNLPSQSMKSVEWKVNGKSIAALDEESIKLYDLTENYSVAKETYQISEAELRSATTIKWNPHSDTQIVSPLHNSIKSWDTRSKSVAWKIEGAHSQQQVRDIDFNPNVMYTVASGGDDCKLKFWDTRKCDKPTAELESHSHWIWAVKYNPSYEQLLISSSSDGTVSLWDLSKLSSVAVDGESQQTGNCLMKTFDEHEDSVYSLAWGSDSFIFASLSYDGRAAVCKVPQEEQDRILFEGMSK